MSEKVRTIRLYGALGARFGRLHHYVVSNSADAVRALCSMIPGFEREMMQSRDQGVAYAVFVGKRNLSVEQLQHPCGDDDIRIAPILQGAKTGGLFQLILGAALVAAAFFNPGALLGAKAAIAVFGMGVSMAMGGIAQLLAPSPKGLSVKDRPENTPSYVFNGPVNTTAQGGPVPLLYGELEIGSAVASAGIYAEDQM
ncbi:tail assembly protein [Burkholderia singularis]|uniref:Phage tail assembly protein I n=1 Tax=Burkholderia singularis TaxID=1503053 RepID=A0A238H567_9BURK|nr:tail assembly protein [Burkholderia singularis]SMG00325.1 Phage tail assembly protein I [Burkholderia singularis]